MPAAAAAGAALNEFSSRNKHVESQWCPTPNTNNRVGELCSSSNVSWLLWSRRMLLLCEASPYNLYLPQCIDDAWCAAVGKENTRFSFFFSLSWMTHLVAMRLALSLPACRYGESVLTTRARMHSGTRRYFILSIITGQLCDREVFILSHQTVPPLFPVPSLHSCSARDTTLNGYRTEKKLLVLGGTRQDFWQSGPP